MSPEAQRIAIAEACGWVELPIGDVWRDKDGNLARADGKAGHFNVPDYLSDLNAMHETEKALTDLQRIHYAGELNRMTQGKHDNLYSHQNHVFATAAQRAEAFLKTLGKWSD